MPLYYQTVCRTEDDACAAFHAMDDVFDDIGEVTGYARKRFANSLLWRFDDDDSVTGRMLEELTKTGWFTEIFAIPESVFASARSYSV